ncbi:MAG: NHL repeat-containing protein [Myxococcales bacterium]
MSRRIWMLALPLAVAAAGCDLSGNGLYLSSCDAGTLAGAQCPAAGTATSAAGGSSSGGSSGASTGGSGASTGSAESSGSSSGGTLGSTSSGASSGSGTSGSKAGTSSSGSGSSSSGSSAGSSTSGGSSGSTGGSSSGGTTGGTPTWSPSWLSLLAGAPGSPGSNAGTGDVALFKSASDVAADGAGHLFVGDTGNDTIRELDLTTGLVTTVAGQPGVAGFADGIGSAATFNGPSWLAYDGQGHLYIVDGGNETIRRLTLATGQVTTVAGTVGLGGCVLGTGTGAQFNGLGRMVHDGNHTLYVAVEFCQYFVAIDTNSWVVTKVAGNGTCGYVDGPAAQAEFGYAGAVAGVFDDPDGGPGTLYTADQGPCGGQTIRKIDLSTQTVSTISGASGQQGSTDGVGPAARFEHAGTVVYDHDGGLYVGDQDALRRIDLATLDVTTVAGAALTPGSNDGDGTSARFDNLSGLSMGLTGPLFLVDQSGGEIREYVPAGGAVTTVAGAPGASGSADSDVGTARLTTPYGTAFDGKQTLFVGDIGDHTVKQIDIATGATTLLAGSPGQAGSVDGTGSGALFAEPGHLLYDPDLYQGDGGLLVVDGPDSETLRTVDVASGAVVTVAGTVSQGGCPSGTALGVGPAAQFNALGQVAYDGKGHLYAADTFCFSVAEIDTATWTATKIAGAGQSCAYADGPASQAEFSYAGNLTGAFSGTGPGVLYLVDSGASFCSGSGGTVRKLDLSTLTVSTRAGTPGVLGSADGVGAAASFHHPGAVAYDGVGSLFISDGDSTVRKLDLATNLVTTVLGVAGRSGVVLGPAPGGLEGPVDLLVAPGPTLIVPDQDANVVFLAR